MKTFWIILLIVALAGTGLLMMRSGPKNADEAILKETEQLFDHPPVKTPQKLPPPTSEPELVVASPTTAPVAPPAAAPQTAPNLVVATSQPATTQPAASMSGESLRDGLDLNIAAAEITPGSIVRQPDGSLRVDDRFTLIGSGTREDPYLLTWEYLISASETYQPRLGQIKLPQRIAFLHGKWIKIEANIAFPLAATSPKEILAMLNMWDGCCIGIVPSPYDAIEVRLAAAAPTSRRHTMTYGAVTGKLSVEPYLVETWLAGLYIMDDAALDQGL
jgi:hypothetical protein